MRRRGQAGQAWRRAGGRRVRSQSLANRRGVRSGLPGVRAPLAPPRRDESDEPSLATRPSPGTSPSTSVARWSGAQVDRQVSGARHGPLGFTLRRPSLCILVRALRSRRWPRVLLLLQPVSAKGNSIQGKHKRLHCARVHLIHELTVFFWSRSLTGALTAWQRLSTILPHHISGQRCRRGSAAAMLQSSCQAGQHVCCSRLSEWETTQTFFCTFYEIVSNFSFCLKLP